MPAIEFATSSAETEGAFSQTVKRMNAEALDLLIRRAEINRRIRCLQQVMQGLRELAPGAELDGRDARMGGSNTAGSNTATEQPRTPADGAAIGQPGERIVFHLPGGPKPALPGLSRACRIALMEREVWHL
jgi:hypothetical protein